MRLRSDAGVAPGADAPLLHLDAATRALIRAEGEGAYPRECCGFLLGRVEAGSKQVATALPSRNEDGAGDGRRYLISPRAHLDARLAAADRNLEILGFYHSHPDRPARPSEYDRMHALPSSTYLILAVTDGRAGELRSWVLAEDTARFREEFLARPSVSKRSRGGGIRHVDPRRIQHRSRS